MNVLGAIVFSGLIKVYLGIAILLLILAAVYWYFFRRQYGNMWTGVIVVCALLLLFFVAYDYNKQRKLTIAGEINIPEGNTNQTKNRGPQTLIEIKKGNVADETSQSFAVNAQGATEVLGAELERRQKIDASSKRPLQTQVININVGEGNILSGGDETVFGDKSIPQSTEYRFTPDFGDTNRNQPTPKSEPKPEPSPRSFAPAGKIKVDYCPDNPMKVENKLGLPTDRLRHMCLIAESVGNVSHIRSQDVTADLKIMLEEFYGKYKHILDDNNDYDNPDDPNDQEELAYRFKRFLEKSSDKGYGTRNWAQWLQSHRLQIKVTFFLD